LSRPASVPHSTGLGRSIQETAIPVAVPRATFTIACTPR